MTDWARLNMWWSRTILALMATAAFTFVDASWRLLL